MKKLIVIGLAAVCVVMAAVALGVGLTKEDAVDAQVQETTRVEGQIVSVYEDSFIISDKDLGEIQVNVDETSVFVGVDASALAAGQTVSIVFDGKMTRSLPMQIFGQEVTLMQVSEEAQEAPRAEGVITAIEEGFFLMTDKELGEIQVNFDETSAFEGVDASALAAGQYAFVVFDGKMTRSLPMQIFGQQIAVYPVSGNVLEVAEDSVILSQENGEVVVYLPEGAPQLTVGDAVTAYTTGAMTMSLPPQTTAMAIVVNGAAE